MKKETPVIYATLRITKYTAHGLLFCLWEFQISSVVCDCVVSPTVK